MAESHSEYVVGVVCREAVCSTSHLIHMTPGVRLGAGGDNLGQLYLSPELVGKILVHYCCM